MARWNAAQYEVFAGFRDRPFYDLLNRVRSEHPRRVVDLGCGNGPLTLSLAERWPEAEIIGVDSSEAMLDRARELDVHRRVQWLHGDIHEWRSDGPVDVLLSNAALQWVPGHQQLIPAWLDGLAPGGWFAMQVPGNFSSPSHRIIRELATEHDRADAIVGALRDEPVSEPAEYTDLLAAGASWVDVWETTYCQILDPAAEQPSPVLEWVKGTALRPVLGVLREGPERDAFLSELAARYERAYPPRAYGVLYPFRRIFAVAQV